MAARTAVLSEGQLARLAEHGEERRAEVGNVLVRVGDRRYPLIAIIEGEAAVLDQTGAEINRHGPGGFLGESDLLSGQTVLAWPSSGAFPDQLLAPLVDLFRRAERAPKGRLSMVAASRESGTSRSLATDCDQGRGFHRDGPGGPLSLTGL